MSSKPTVGVLYAPGINSHHETVWAFERAGAKPRVVSLTDVLRGVDRLDGSDAFCVPGGFAYGDHLGAGALAGQFLRIRLADQLAAVRQRPMIAICNGFQIGMRAGLFGGGVALSVNAAGTFRNVPRQPHHVERGTRSVWLNGLEGQTLRFPCAHGEGRFLHEASTSSSEGGQWEVALRYPEGHNPDGSADDIAGIATSDGLVLGLMNHPERAPDEPGTIDIFANGVRAARV